MHNGNFYPDDIVIEIIDGKRNARIGLDLPTIWTQEAKVAASNIDFLTGWEMARLAYRNAALVPFHKHREAMQAEMKADIAIYGLEESCRRLACHGFNHD